jgi:hypothetical protein
MRNDTSGNEDPRAALERTLVDEFLGSRGHTRESAGGLPAADAAALLGAAHAHASLRLAEIESKAHYVEGIRRPS